MRPRSFWSCFLLLVILALGITGSSRLHAQAIEHEDRMFAFDSVFHFGALGLSYGRACLVYDSLGLTFVHDYSAPINLDYAINPANWTTGYGTGARWSDSMKAVFFQTVKSCGMKMTATLGTLHSLCFLTHTAENYYDFSADYENQPHSELRNTVHTNGFVRGENHDSLRPLERHPIRAGFFDTCSTCDTMIVGPAHRTLYGLNSNGGYENIFNKADGSYYTAADDSSGYFDVTITMNAEGLPQSDTAVIAYAVLYR